MLKVKVDLSPPIRDTARKLAGETLEGRRRGPSESLIVTLFDAADFSGLTGSSDLAVAEIEHELFFELDEAGTRAAAATGASLGDSHGPTIAVDAPSCLRSRDRPTRAVLCLGRLVDPRPQ